MKSSTISKGSLAKKAIFSLALLVFDQLAGRCAPSNLLLQKPYNVPVKVDLYVPVVPCAQTEKVTGMNWHKVARMVAPSNTSPITSLFT